MDSASASGAEVQILSPRPFYFLKGLRITEVSLSQTEILDTLDAEGVVEPKLVKRLLKKAEN